MRKRMSAVIIVIGFIGLIGIMVVERKGSFLSTVVTPPQESIANRTDNTAPIQITSWDDYGRGVARREYWFKNSTQGRLVLYRFNQMDFQARLVHRVPAQIVREWLPSDARDTLIVNGAYFDQNDFPVGYTVINGNRIGTGAVSGKTTTLVSLSPRVQFGATRTSVRDGFETYPMLLKNGKATVSTDSKLYARRTILGTDTAGMMYIGVIPDSSVSLYELSRTLSDLDISWNTVVNLDGGPSTGLSARFGDHKEYFDSMTTIPNVLIVERR